MTDRGQDSWLDEHGAMIARIAASHERSPADAEDLVQDILLAVIRALPHHRGEAGLRTFIARIALNVSISQVRRSARRRTVPVDEALPDAGPGPETLADLAQRRTRLEAAVRSLPLSLRQPLLLFLEGFSAQDIAETLGLSRANAEVRISRAKAALKARMEGGDD